LLVELPLDVEREEGSVSARHRSVSSRMLHRLAEARSLAYHREIARRLQTDPGILERARARVDAWMREGGRSAPYARRWSEVLGCSLAAISDVLSSESEEAVALRQSTPFAGELDPRERWRLWRDVRERFVESGGSR
jgi:hypothetical protein